MNKETIMNKKQTERKLNSVLMNHERDIIYFMITLLDKQQKKTRATFLMKMLVSSDQSRHQNFKNNQKISMEKKEINN